MKIITLMEDTSSSPLYHAEHGLCFYIETGNHRILADTGASPLTWENADRLEVDLSRIDSVFLSHGHYDHTGGLLSFVEKYPAAKLYMQACADGLYYNGDRYIGIDRRLCALSSMHRLDGDRVIDDSLSVFSRINGCHPIPRGNRSLLKHTLDGILPDDFRHEMCLVVRDSGRLVLFSGCAHTGILNILERFCDLCGRAPDAVFSGFHMIQKDRYTPEYLAEIRETARSLKEYPTRFYTGHCTGDIAYEEMKPILSDRLFRIRAGSTVTF